MVNLLFKLIASFTAFLFTLGVVPHEARIIESDSRANLSFIAIADAHMETNNKKSRDEEIRAFYDMSRNLDSKALVMVGDSTMNGQFLEFAWLYGILNKTEPAEDIYLAWGNHDTGNGEGSYERLADRFIRTRNTLGNLYEPKLYFSTECEGYSFIFLAAENHAVNSGIMSQEQYAWLVSQLEQASARAKPIFVFSHYANYNIENQGNLGELLAQYKNVFLLYGHTHRYLCASSVNVLSSENSCYSINLPAFRDGNDPEVTVGMCPGAELSVYDDYVRLRFRAFEASQWLEDFDYSFQLSA